MNPEELLSNLGLNPDASKLYLSLLKDGPQIATKLSSTTRIKRTYIYALTQELIKMGLVTATKKEKTTIFSANNPDLLMDIAENKRLKAELAKSSLESSLGNLKGLFQVNEAKPIVIYYEGLEGVKKTYLDLLKVGQPIKALVETTKVDPEVYKWLTTEFVAERSRLNIPVQSIVASGKLTKDYVAKNETEIRQTKEISSDKYPFENEIDIYGNKVSIIKNKVGEKLIGIIIENEEIAATFRSWFDLTWSNLR